MSSELQRIAYREYYHRTKDRKRAVMLKLDRKDDADVIGKLDSVPNKTDYIRVLVRNDLSKTNK